MPNTTDPADEFDAAPLHICDEVTLHFSLDGLNSLLNHTKDQLLARLSADLGKELEHNRYILFAHKRGMLGRFWEKLCGKQGSGVAVDVIVVDTAKTRPVK